MSMDNFWELLPILLLAMGQLSLILIVMDLHSRLKMMEDFPKFLLEALEEVSHGDEE